MLLWTETDGFVVFNKSQSCYQSAADAPRKDLSKLQSGFADPTPLAITPVISDDMTIQPQKIEASGCTGDVVGM